MGIKQQREQKGISQQDLASLFGVTQSAVAKWESREVAPRADKLIAMAKYFNCSIEELLQPEEENVFQKT